MAEVRAERRLAAVLAADVVGYSRLMAADETGTHARLKVLRKDVVEPAIAEYRGRIVKLIGDGALIEFASAVDAVECAVAIQEGVAERQGQAQEDQRLAFRVGINIGDIIIEDDDIYGDGVNIAARLEALSAPGGICVSRNVYNQVKNKVDFGFEPMGEHTVKNIPEPVVVYRLLTDSSLVAKAIGLKRAGTSGRRLVALAAAVVLLLGVGSAIWRWNDVWPVDPGSEVQSASLDTRRVAVLPFVNMSPNAEDEYFADGITEELITQLSKVGELSVIARTSVMPYKDTDKSIAEIARELSVGTILEGSVRKAGDQVRVAAQLIDVASEVHLWAESYDREMAEIFVIQSDIAEEVAGALQIMLLTGVREQLRQPGTNDPLAYELYLKGLHALKQRTREELNKGRDYLEQALARDPNFAQAHARMSEYYSSIRWAADIAVDEANAKARMHAEKALALNEGLAEAWTSLAMVRLYTYDWSGAEAAFKRAIEANPSHARAHGQYGHKILLAVQGHNDEAIGEIRRAIELDPLSKVANSNLGWALYHSDRWEDAAEAFRQTIATNPEYAIAHLGLGQSLISLGRHNEGLSAIRDAVEISGGVSFLLAYLGWGYALAGQTADARDVLATLRERVKDGTARAMHLAWVYMGLGDKDAALDWLDQAYEERDPGMTFVRLPEFQRALAPHPRYNALLERLRLAT